MPTQQTINEALAYVAITGSKKYLHLDTRIAIEKYVTFDLQTVTYKMTDEGMALVRTTKFWKAHERIIAQGYVLHPGRRQRPSMITYSHPEQVQVTGGRAYTRIAFTSYRGDVYVDELNEGGYYSPALQKELLQPAPPVKRTAPAEVNKALKAAGFQDVTIIRGNGYYWFDDATTAITSIYSNSLFGFTTEEIVEHVRSELKRIKERA